MEWSLRLVTVYATKCRPGAPVHARGFPLGFSVDKEDNESRKLEMPSSVALAEEGVLLGGPARASCPRTATSRTQRRQSSVFAYGRGAEQPKLRSDGRDPATGPRGRHRPFELCMESTEFPRGQADGDATGREVHGPDQLSAVLDPLLAGQRGLVTRPIGRIRDGPPHGEMIPNRLSVGTLGYN